MPRKLTHEEFMEKFYVKNKNAENIEVLGEYINSQTKVCIICPEHGEFWQAPSKHLYGRGCPKCGKKNNV